MSFRGRLGTPVLVTTTTLASTAKQYFFLTIQEGLATPSEIYPPCMNTYHITAASGHTILQSPLLHLSEIGKGKTDSPNEVSG